jgi:hypothetical protein
VLAKMVGSAREAAGDRTFQLLAPVLTRQMPTVKTAVEKLTSVSGHRCSPAGFVDAPNERRGFVACPIAG